MPLFGLAASSLPRRRFEVGLKTVLRLGRYGLATCVDVHGRALSHGARGPSLVGVWTGVQARAGAKR